MIDRGSGALILAVPILAVFTAFAVSCNSGAAGPGEQKARTSIAEEKVAAGKSETGAYDLAAAWPEAVCGEGYTWGSTGGVWAVSPDRVFVFQRGCLPGLPPSPSNSPIPERRANEYSLAAKDKKYWPRWDHLLLVFDEQGKLVESWEQHNKLFVRPHGVFVSPYDPEGNVWLVDDGAHQIFKFSPDGRKLLMTLGEHRVPGNDRNHFNRPTSIAWLPNGDFYVGDGYGNARVVKFSRDGRYVMEWGKPGKGAGEFNIVHALAIDKERRIYVADRANSRIQIFDENGRYLREWRNIQMPLYMLVTGDESLWLSHGDEPLQVSKFDLSGKLLYAWGAKNQEPGGLWAVHQFSVDPKGNFYTADIVLGRAQKFVPRPGADAAKLMGQPQAPGY